MFYFVQPTAVHPARCPYFVWKHCTNLTFQIWNLELQQFSVFYNFDACFSFLVILILESILYFCFVMLIIINIRFCFDFLQLAGAEQIFKGLSPWHPFEIQWHRRPSAKKSISLTTGKPILLLLCKSLLNWRLEMKSFNLHIDFDHFGNEFAITFKNHFFLNVLKIFFNNVFSAGEWWIILSIIFEND